MSSAVPPILLLRLLNVVRGFDFSEIWVVSKHESLQSHFDKIPKAQNPKPVPSFFTITALPILLSQEIS